MNCPTCGEPVEVYSADEGTHSYQSVAMKRIKELESALHVIADLDPNKGTTDSIASIACRVARNALLKGE